MEPRDIIALCALGISALALVVAVVVAWKSSVHNAIVRQYAAAGSETAVLAQINAARGRVADVALKLQEVVKGRKDLLMDDKRHAAGLETVYKEAVAVLLNTYELACSMYRAGKLDKAAFKRQYFDEIGTLFKSEVEAYKTRLHGLTSTYKAMQKVYEEWYVMEK